VTRSPSLHPGDMRLLTAVDCEIYRNYHNVIIFSSRGSRPE
jgi:RNA-dependent RNA polymerase